MLLVNMSGFSIAHLTTFRLCCLFHSLKIIVLFVAMPMMISVSYLFLNLTGSRPLHPVSEEYLEMAYQQISSFQEETETSWFPSWVSRSSGEQLTFSLFTACWQQYLSTLSPGKGFDMKDTWIELPESDETKELFERLLSSIPSLNVSDTLQNESVIQSLLVLFDVYEMTENHESRVLLLLSPHL